MVLDIRSDVPLYKQLSKIMREKIRSGEWKTNEKIPTEPELCEEYGVSRMTVRLALDELRKDGSIIRRQGRGTFVSPPQINQQLSAFYSFTASPEHESAGYSIEKKILSWTVIEADELLQKKLCLAPKSQVYAIERLLYSNGTPFAVEISNIPVHLCPQLSESDVREHGLYASLDQFGIKPNSASETFEAVIVPPKYQKLLRTGSASPGMHVCRLAQHDNLIVEYCESLVNGNLVKYNIALH